MIKGWYYLHTNGDLIFKQNLSGTPADLRESDSVVTLWPIDTDDRENAWRILIEALSCGAKLDRVKTLANKWHCGNDDGQIYADRIGIKIGVDGDQWCATRKDFESLQESPAGFGDTALEAMAVLCKELGYKPRKTWGLTFADLLK